MRRITRLRIGESVKQHRLVFEEGGFDVFERIAVYFFAGMISMSALLAIWTTDFRNPNNLFISATLWPFMIVFGIYTIYRKATEKFLIKINTGFNKEVNKELLLNFANAKHFEISRKSGDCLVMNEQLSNFNSNYKKSMIFIIRNDLVLFAVLKDQFRLNMPTLISHLLLKKELITMFRSQK